MKETIGSHALLIVKESYFEQMLAANNQSQLAAITSRAPGLELEAQSHAQHVETLSKVKLVLEQRGVTYELANSRDLELVAKFARADFVVAIGGDGTFLMASHFIKDGTRILGVNSAPITSFGHFCICDSISFASVLDKITKGDLKPIELLRLEVSIDGKFLPKLALNEFLIAHKEPAASSRYRLNAKGQSEKHVCSGLLVATPSGSTGFLRSEGGSVLAIDEQKFAFLERAPFLRLGEQHQLRAGLLPRGEALEIVSEMEGGMVYIDNNHAKYPFDRGARLVVRAAQANLSAYVDPLCHSPYMNSTKP
jgi:NAD kinase